jgi:thiol-disulfide isomerase/thioredoxin
MKTKNIILIIVLVLIVSTIWFLESKKPQKISSLNSEKIAVTEDSPIMEDATSTSMSATSTMQTNKSKTNRSAILASKAKQYSSAVEIIPGGKFINSDPFTLKSLVGKKVILVDFWTYSCINCQRTIPYLNAWYEKYKDQGLVIVGVHTPEFGFEKDYTNVVQGVKDLGIKYPVVQDNNRDTWNAYQNRYWPHEYLIDIDGFVVHDKIGEGGYDESEREIQKALQERKNVLGISNSISKSTIEPESVISLNPSMIKSYETYFGSDRNVYLANGPQNLVGSRSLTIPSTIESNKLYLGGTWDFQGEYGSTQSPAQIVYKYNSKNVYLVGSSKAGATLKISLDGVVTKTISVKQNTLYTIVEGKDYGEHTLKIDIVGGDLDAYTFTFG